MPPTPVGPKRRAVQPVRDQQGLAIVTLDDET
jgi:hypothetical protein